MTKPSPDSHGKPSGGGGDGKSLIGHLTDLRRAIVWSVVAFVVGVLLACVFLREPLMDLVFEPIRRMGWNPVIVGVAEGLMVQLQLAFTAGALMASPVVLWQLAAFTFPALHAREKKAFMIWILLTVVLFVGGVLFAYRFVLRLGLETFLGGYAQGLSIMLSASRYLSFLKGFLLPFGLVFQIPLLSAMLTHIGFVTPERLRRFRKYAVLAILTVAMLLTPPDVLSQLLLSLPMIVLYEMGIFLASLVMKHKERKRAAAYELAKTIYPLE